VRCLLTLRGVLTSVIRQLAGCGSVGSISESVNPKANSKSSVPFAFRGPENFQKNSKKIATGRKRTRPAVEL
jgi:hypothetical protein